MGKARTRGQNRGNQGQNRGRPRGRTSGGRASGTRGGDLWLFGTHSVAAALGNPRRGVRRVCVLDRLAERYRAVLESAWRERGGTEKMPAVELLSESGLEGLLPRGAVHQGLAVLADYLPSADIGDIIKGLGDDAGGVLVMLDSVTDPHNVGAVLRSCGVFGVAGLVVKDRGSPEEGGVMAKSASGALEIVPVARVVNLSRTVSELREEFGFVCYALGADGDGDSDGDGMSINELGEKLTGTERVLLVLGSEGKGVGRLVRESCDGVVYIPAAGEFRELNVSNAAAVALYALTRARN